MTKLKSLLAGIVLFIGAGLFNSAANAQSYPDGKVDAWTKQNPAKPIQVDSIQATDLGNGQTLVDIVLEGVGEFAIFEICCDYTTPCLCGWNHNGGNRTEVIYLVPTANYSGCWVSLANVHGWGGAPQ